MLAENGPQVAGQIHGTHQRLVQLTILKLADGHLQCPDAGTFLAGDRKTRPADAKFAGDPAGHDASERTHGAVGGQGWSGSIPKPGRPFRKLFPRQFPPQFQSPPGCLSGQSPTQAEVGAVQVKGNADKDTGRGVIVPVAPGIVQRLCRSLQHEQLLRKHLFNLAGRNTEAVGRQRHLIHGKTGERRRIQTFRAEPFTLECSMPPIWRSRGRCVIAAQYPLLKRQKRLPLTETGIHADYGDGVAFCLQYLGLCVSPALLMERAHGGR